MVVWLKFDNVFGKALYINKASAGTFFLYGACMLNLVSRLQVDIGLEIEVAILLVCDTQKSHLHEINNAPFLFMTFARSPVHGMGSSNFTNYVTCVFVSHPGHWRLLQYIW